MRPQELKRVVGQGAGSGRPPLSELKPGEVAKLAALIRRLGSQELAAPRPAARKVKEKA